jgi:pimeloyl-ACP methyl ester carboxylesterase
VFIHGVLNDHSVWILQSRWFANHGWNVLAVDLPGHCKSEGAAASVEDAAQFVPRCSTRRACRRPRWWATASAR